MVGGFKGTSTRNLTTFTISRGQSRLMMGINHDQSQSSCSFLLLYDRSFYGFPLEESSMLLPE
jgi:hypothetical protein